MVPNNKTLATEFILLGFSKNVQTSITVFMLCCVIYSITCIGNILIICLIIISPHLHTPMYFFLCNLSFIDLFFSSSVVPKFLADIFSIRRLISYSACSFQVFAILYLGGTECLLLALMAYDRYVAICCPLYYAIRMNWKICYQFIAMVWISSFIITVMPTLAMPSPICNPNQINHFMCDVLAVVNLSCENIFVNEILIFLVSLFLIFVPFILIIVSYICIICSILKIDSVNRDKAFSTCTSHLIVVILYYGTVMLIHSGSISSYLFSVQKYISVVYVILTPMLNPLIYSLKNREVKDTFKKLLIKMV
ncbi:olfactory receptor 5V1-like [Discoglossus pictus]